MTFSTEPLCKTRVHFHEANHDTTHRRDYHKRDLQVIRNRMRAHLPMIGGIAPFRPLEGDEMGEKKHSINNNFSTNWMSLSRKTTNL